MSEQPIDLLQGAVDLHVHPGPSPYPRRIDAIGAARSAAEAGMAAIVLKSHHNCTAMQIQALRPYGLEELDIDVFGGIVLNSQVGGLNPHAVSLCLAMGGRVVWLPTISSPAHIAHSAGHFPTAVVQLLDEEPLDVLGADGTVKPEVVEILRLIAEADAVLAAGHLPPRSVAVVFEAARAEGVQRLVVNHPNFIVNASLDDAARLVELGAYIEHAASMYDEQSRFRSFELDELLRWIDFIGVEHTILASDLGQADNPLPAEALARLGAALLDRGLAKHELASLLSTNPAAVLGVEMAGEVDSP